MDTTFAPDDWLKHADALRRIARAMLASEAESEDVVQSAFLTALERPPKRLTFAWLKRVVQNRAVDRLRRERAGRERPLEGFEERARMHGPAIDERLELHRTLVEAVEGLSEPIKRTLCERYFEGKLPARIAAESGVPVKTVKARLHRGLAELRAELQRRHGADRGWVAALAAAFVDSHRGPSSAGPPPWSAAVPAAAAAPYGGLAIMAKKWTAVVVLGLALAGAVRWGVLGNRGAATSGLPSVPDTVDERQVESHASALDAPDGANGGPTQDSRRVSPAAGNASEPAEAGPATRGSLIVRARWPDERPAAGVNIRLVSRSVSLPDVGVGNQRCDAHGQARFDGLAPGTVEVLTDREDYQGGPEATIHPGEVATVEFSVGSGVRVRGSVLDENERALAGARIWLTTGRSDWLGGAVVGETDETGHFELESIPQTQSLGAIAAGYSPSELVDLETLALDREPVEVTLRLTQPGGALRGIVRDPQGRPLAGAWVSVGAYADTEFGIRGDGVATERWTPRPVQSDAVGAYRLEGLPSGTQPLRAWLAPCPIWKGEVDLEAGVASELDIQLEAGATLSGTVTFADGEPAAGAVVRVFDRAMPRGALQFGQYYFEDPFGHPAAEADEHGDYALVGLPSGTLHLYANPRRPLSSTSRAALMRSEDTLEARSGDALVWSPVLSEGHVIEGSVRFADGVPMASHYVFARQDKAGEAYTLKTDEQGRFRFLNVENEPHTLGVQLWNAPADAEPMSLAGVWPDGAPVELVASFAGSEDGGAGEVTCEVLDSGGRVTNEKLLEVVLDYDNLAAWKSSVERDGYLFRFAGVPAGRYRAVAICDGIPIASSEWFELAAEQILHLGELETEPAGSVTFNLVRGSGTRELEVLGFLKQAGQVHSPRLEFGSADELRVENLSPGSYALILYARGLAYRETPVEVAAGVAQALSIELEPALRFPYEIWWPENHATGPLTVTITDAAGELVWENSEPNSVLLSRPYSRAANLRLGRYTLVASTDSGLKCSVSFEVRTLEGDPPPLRVELE